MGVYNQWDFEILKKAINSILNQTLRDLEFIIYDDGSHPQVANSLKELAAMDDRIILIGMEENQGLAFSLNACIDKARGEYIARMDADDISLPDRLQKQVDFLEAHPEYMWCGTNAFVFDEDGIWSERIMPECPTKEDYLRFSPYIHPSVMYRASIFEKMDGYLVCKETLRCEDYEIFMRFRYAGYKGYNIQENLFYYRENKASYQRRTFAFRLNEAKIRYRNFKSMEILFPKGWIYVLRPLVAAFIPHKILMWMKRTGVKEHESTDRVLQPNIAEETHL